MSRYDEPMDRETRKRRRQAEDRRSHINDPAPKRWTLANMWVWHKHLPVDWGVVVCTIILTLVGSLMVLSASSYAMGVSGDGDAMSEFNTQVQGMILGGIGFCGSRVSRIYRDLRITRISGGTGEIQTVIAARQVLKKYR